MKINSVIGISLVVGLGLAGTLLFPPKHNIEPSKTQLSLPSETKPIYPLNKNIRYSYRLTNNSAERIEMADFYAYTPIPKTPYQQLSKFESSFPYQLIKDKFGNQILHIQIPSLAPYASRTIKVKAVLAMSHKANLLPLRNTTGYLVNTELLNMDQQPVIKLAARFNHSNKHKLVEEIFQWTMRSIQYSGYEHNDKPVLETLQSMSGDCTDYMHVFTALSRSKGIPTREIGGYVVKHNKIIHPEDYHNWAEYLLDETWHFSDPQNKVFNKNAGNYIAFRHYGDDHRSPLNNYHRYHVTDDRLQVSMN